MWEYGDKVEFCAWALCTLWLVGGRNGGVVVEQLGEDFERVGGVAASAAREVFCAQLGVFVGEVRDCEDGVDVHGTYADDVLVRETLRHVAGRTSVSEKW